MRAARAYKTELAPNDVERTLLLKHCGAARWAYNWGLQRNIDVHRMNRLPVAHIKRPTAVDLHRELNLLKKTTVPWMYEVSKCAPQEALRDLDRAFQNFFEERIQPAVQEVGMEGQPDVQFYPPHGVFVPALGMDSQQPAL